MQRTFRLTFFTPMSLALGALLLAAPAVSAASLKAATAKPRPAVQQFKTTAPRNQHQKVIQGCEDDVSQTSYDGPCDKHEDTIVIEGCHNNVTQTSEPGRCPE